MKRRETVFSITENGNTRCGVTRHYAGLGGFTQRLIKNEVDPASYTARLFLKPDRVSEISREEFDTYVDDYDNVDRVRAIIEVDVDANTIRADEEIFAGRQYREYPLDLLMEKAPLLRKPGTNYIGRERLYYEMDSSMRQLARQAEQQGQQEQQSGTVTMQM